MKKGKSMYDEFREDIEKWCDQGLTIKEMFAKLPPGYRYQGLYNYIRLNNIRDNAWTRELEKRNKCNQCEYCHKVKNVMGTYNKADNRICTLSWRLIQYSVRHSPVWCEKGENNDNSQTF